MTDVPTHTFTVERESSEMTLQFFQRSMAYMLQESAESSRYTAFPFDLQDDNAVDALSNAPLRVSIYSDDDGVHAENEELTVFGFGETVSEALADFRTSLAETWDGLANTPEKNLTADAVELQRRLKVYLGSRRDTQG